MRKSTIFIVLLALVLALPMTAHAQSPVTFASLEIQLWPDYDQPSLLVIYDFKVAEDTQLPIEVSLRMPVGSQLLAVAKAASGGLVNVDFKPVETQGNYDVVTLTIDDLSLYHFEFYTPYTRNGQTRSLSFTWPGDYATQTLLMRLQEPVGATNMVTQPALTRTGPEQDGFVYYITTLTNTTAGEEIPFEASYNKADDTLSVTSLGVQPTQPLDQPASGQSSYMTYLPWILGGLGVVLIVGGGVWYWMTGNSSKPAKKTRKRHTMKEDAEDDESDDGETYCTKCGKRTKPGDRFCRACGNRIK